MTDSTPTPKQQAVIDGMRRAGVPARYMDVEPYELPCGRPWGYVTGAAGSGKTYTACGMLRTYLHDYMHVQPLTNINGEVIHRVYSAPHAAFITAPDYLEAVKAGFDGEGRARRYRMTPFLVLDDLGQEVPTQWAVSEIYKLINYRYGEDLPTIITSQYKRNQLARKLARNGGEEQALAIVSRLSEVCEDFEQGDIDRRLA